MTEGVGTRWAGGGGGHLRPWHVGFTHMNGATHFWGSRTALTVWKSKILPILFP